VGMSHIKSHDTKGILLNKKESKMNKEYCEACNDNHFLLSNDENNNPDLQRCDECKYFENDDEAKKYVLKFINKEAK